VPVGVLVVVRGDDRRARRRVPEPDEVDALLQVDRPVERLPELPVPERRVALAVVAVVTVKTQLVETVGDDGLRPDAGLALELRHLIGHEAAGAVDDAALEVLDHRVGVGEVHEVDLVDLRRRATPIRIRDHLDVGVLLPLDAVEWSGPDDRRLVLEALGRVFVADLRPDVLGHDRHVVADHVRLGLRAGELDRVVVDHLHLVDEVRVRRPVLEVAVDDVVVREGDVLGGHALAVVPHRVLAQREGPDQLVLADRPVGRKAVRVFALHRSESGGVVTDQRVVREVPDLEGLRGVADERVQAVRFVGPADAVHDLATLGRSGR